MAIATVILGLAGFGCSSRRDPAPPPASTTTAGVCPTAIPGTQVSVDDTHDGVALTFTTTGDVAQVRASVRAMAQHHSAMVQARPGRGMGPGAGRMGAGRMGAGMMGPGMGTVPSTATVEDVDGGARLVLAPNDPARLAELRERARAHATMMVGGRCPFLDQGA
ncbi:MAG: hypothetical protein ACM31C_32020 [Acidobacteriota bacterium]